MTEGLLRLLNLLSSYTHKYFFSASEQTQLNQSYQLLFRLPYLSSFLRKSYSKHTQLAPSKRSVLWTAYRVLSAVYHFFYKAGAQVSERVIIGE